MLFTPRTCARDKVIGPVVVVVVVVVIVVVVIIVVVVSTKIAKSQKIGVRVLYATKQSKVTKNYLLVASNRLERPMSTTNGVFSTAMPIDQTYRPNLPMPCAVSITNARSQNREGLLNNKIYI